MSHFKIFILAGFLFLALEPVSSAKEVPTEAVIEKHMVQKKGAPDALSDDLARELVEEVTIESPASQVSISVSPELTEKLSAKQLADLVEYALRVQNRPPESLLKEDILVPFIGFSAFVLIILMALYFPYRKSRDMQETLRVMIRENHEIPTAYFEAMNRKPLPNGQADLRKGVLLSALGLAAGLLIFLANPNSSHDGSWSVGCIPLFVGLGYLLLWKTRPASEQAV